jgi:nucleotide-binding universal stress UspA family protein
MIKDIIVSLGSGANDKAGRYAVSVAAAFDAHILGVACIYDPVIPGSVMGGIPPEFIESQRRESEKAARAAVARFEQAAKRDSLSFGTLVLGESAAGAAGRITAMARRFDLAVVGQPEPDAAAAGDMITEAVLFGAGRPVIAVPFIQKDDLKLDRVMVCWDGSRAAARAIADAMPMLEKSGTVEIVMVGAGDDKRDEIAGADLGEHLARHGIKVDVKRMAAPDLDVANALLSYAADSAATFLVMGGYGHSRLREFVLGGVTRSVLSTMTVPTLLSH